jgi:hypothetical protein
MIGMPALIGKAANSPMPLIGDLCFRHSRFRRCSLISSRGSFIDRISLSRSISVRYGKAATEQEQSIWHNDRATHAASNENKIKRTQDGVANIAGCNTREPVYP